MLKIIKRFISTPLRVALIICILLATMNIKYHYGDTLLYNLPANQIGQLSMATGQSRDILNISLQTSFDSYEKQLSRLRALDIERDAFLMGIKDGCEPVVLDNETSNMCPCVPDILYGAMPVPMDAPTIADIAHHHPEMTSYGHYSPPSCTARQRVAVIVPYRDRDFHLRLFLYHMLPILQRHQVEFRIFAVEQVASIVFNKAMMMNAGFLEAKRNWTFDCVIFHDIDMLLEDDRNLYYCGETPTHLGAFIDKYNYELIYPDIFGGAIALKSRHFEEMNGFSNRFYGWGGEDDNMYSRVRHQGFVVYRNPSHVARYRMMPHSADQGNPIGKKRERAYSRKFLVDAQRDGLNTIVYILHKFEDKQIYTHLLVEPACPLHTKGSLGYSEASIHDVIEHVALDSCRRSCSQSVECMAITWNMVTLQCLLHDEYLKPVPKQNYLFITKDCSDQNQAQQSEPEEKRKT